MWHHPCLIFLLTLFLPVASCYFFIGLRGGRLFAHLRLIPPLHPSYLVVIRGCETLHLCSSIMLFSGARPMQARKMFSSMALCLARAFTTGVPGGTYLRNQFTINFMNTLNCEYIINLSEKLNCRRILTVILQL